MIQDPVRKLRICCRFTFIVLIEFSMVTGVVWGLGLVVSPLHCDRDHILVPEMVMVMFLMNVVLSLHRWRKKGSWQLMIGRFSESWLTWWGSGTGPSPCRRSSPLPSTPSVPSPCWLSWSWQRCQERPSQTFSLLLLASSLFGNLVADDRGAGAAAYIGGTLGGSAKFWAAK